MPVLLLDVVIPLEFLVVADRAVEVVVFKVPAGAGVGGFGEEDEFLAEFRRAHGEVLSDEAGGKTGIRGAGLWWAVDGRETLLA